MRVVVLGLGRFGGGAGVLRRFAERGHEVVVSDLAPPDRFADVVSAWAHRRNVRFAFGGHDPADFERADLVVASPAIPPDAEPLRIARSRGVPITTEVALFLESCPAPVLAVTGSNGKTTTATLLARMLEEAGVGAALAGNMGISLLPGVESLDPAVPVVLEISSFQLEMLPPRLPEFAASLVTGVTPNHLDRHGTFERYAELKLEAPRRTAPGAPVVLREADATARRWIAEGALEDRTHRFAEELPSVLGRAIDAAAANGVVAMNARQAAVLLRVHRGASPDIDAAVLRAVAGFRPLEHRLEPVGRARGFLFIDDSKSTTPEATARAVEAFQGPRHLLAGGYDKGLDLGPLVEAAADCASIRLFGQTGPKILEALERRPLRASLHSSLEAALEDLLAREAPPGTVLFSPGHASYGLWRDYRERGRAFASWVRGLADRGDL